MKTTPIKGRWHIIKGKIKQGCGKLSRNKPRYAEGREEELIGRLQRRLGKTPEEIELLLASRPYPGRPHRHD